MMDDKGFIFTADAALALIVVFVFTGSIVTYTMLPIYQGEDHQHLESIAGSALDEMEQTGTLRMAAVEYSNGSQQQAADDLQNALSGLIPPGIGYRITVGDNPSVTSNGSSNNLLTSNDQVTKVKVISGPQEGWMGRAYYKIEHIDFINVTSTTVTTVWNFHNYLSNYGPWSGGLNTYNYWGGTNPTGHGTQTGLPITFYVPSDGPINGVQVLTGAADSNSKPTAYGVNLALNGVLRQTLNSGNFQYIYTGEGYALFNNNTNLTPSWLNSGANTFNLSFIGATSTDNMPWFSILVNYTTSIDIPQGILFNTFTFNDIAGVGRPAGSNGILYNLNTAQLTNTTGRTVTWNTIQTSDIDLSTPFTITGLPGLSNGGTASAVGSTCDVYLPNNTRLFDAYTVVNAYGGEDGALVQVKDPVSNTWHTVFTSFNSGSGTFTARSDGGYANVPGVISLHDSFNTSRDYLTAGHNTVRIITWDDVPSTDYDLVGLKNCYTTIAYSSLPIRWDTTTFDSYQNDSSGSTKTLTESKKFNIDPGAENALLFMGLGLNTRNVAVTVSNGTASNTIYNGPPEYVLNLTNYDTSNIFSYVNASGDRVPKAGNFTMNITVTPSLAYESGDLASSTGSYGYQGDPEIYSGTRIAILYPQFLENDWATAFNSTPDGAEAAATANLMSDLQSKGYNVNSSLIKVEALYSGDVPNAIPIRLELWKQ